MSDVVQSAGGFSAVIWASVSNVCVLLTLYMIKSALGIDVFHVIMLVSGTGG